MKEVQETLANEFLGFLHGGMMQSSAMTPESLRQSVGRDTRKQLDSVFAKSVAFCRLIMMERAVFKIEMPSLAARNFNKEEEDAQLTALGQTVGVSGGPDRDTDVAGEVKLVASPMLVKYGDGGGRCLDQGAILVRAFAVMVKLVPR